MHNINICICKRYHILYIKWVYLLIFSFKSYFQKFGFYLQDNKLANFGSKDLVVH